MRVEPAVKKFRTKEEKQARVDKITRIVAIIAAFLSTFIFFVKIIFF